MMIVRSRGRMARRSPKQIYALKTKVISDYTNWVQGGRKDGKDNHSSITAGELKHIAMFVLPCISKEAPLSYTKTGDMVKNRFAEELDTLGISWDVEMENVVRAEPVAI